MWNFHREELEESFDGGLKQNINNGKQYQHQRNLQKMRVRSYQEMLLEYEGIGLDANDMEERIELLSKYKYSVIVEGEALEFDTLEKWIHLNMGESFTKDLWYGKIDYNYGFKEIFIETEVYAAKMIATIPNMYTIYPNAYPTASIIRTNGPDTVIDYEPSNKEAIIYRNPTET